MPTIGEEAKAKEELNDVLEKLSEFTSETLIQREKLGTDLHFEAGVPYFARILRLFEDVRLADLDGVPLNLLQAIKKHAHSAFDLFSRIQNFSTAVDNPRAQRDALITEAQDNYQSYYGTIAPPLAYAGKKGTDFSELERRAKDTADRVDQILNEAKADVAKAQKEASTVLESIRNVAAESGVTQHQIHFENEAKTEGRSAVAWLVATIIFGVFALGFAFNSVDFFVTAPDLSLPQLAQIAIAKVLTFSVLSFGLIWCSSIYKTHKHNYVINRHRRNALGTFEAFAKATEDVDVKNAVLLRATEAIFSPAATGYSSPATETKGGARFLEILPRPGRASTGSAE